MGLIEKYGTNRERERERERERLRDVFVGLFFSFSWDSSRNTGLNRESVCRPAVRAAVHAVRQRVAAVAWRRLQRRRGLLVEPARQ
eukprot:SAG31_NODE_713_length_12651_cov_180.009481_11_plen_86_part_00